MQYQKKQKHYQLLRFFFYYYYYYPVYIARLNSNKAFFFLPLCGQSLPYYSPFMPSSLPFLLINSYAAFYRIFSTYVFGFQKQIILLL